MRIVSIIVAFAVSDTKYVPIKDAIGASLKAAEFSSKFLEGAIVFSIHVHKSFHILEAYLITYRNAAT